MAESLGLVWLRVVVWTSAFVFAVGFTFGPAWTAVAATVGWGPLALKYWPFVGGASVLYVIAATALDLPDELAEAVRERSEARSETLRNFEWARADVFHHLFATLGVPGAVVGRAWVDGVRAIAARRWPASPTLRAPRPEVDRRRPIDRVDPPEG